MVKDAPNNIPDNIIGSSQTSREILEDGDIPTFPVVLITLNHIVQMNGPKSGSHYPHSARRLIQSVYGRIFSAIIRHKELNLSNEKWKLVYLDQYSPIKISKPLWNNDIHTPQYRRKILLQLFIFMELKPFPYYFMITKTLNSSHKKWKLV